MNKSERPPWGVPLLANTEWSRWVCKYFDDPDFAQARIDSINSESNDDPIAISWAVREMSACAVLDTLQDVLVQGGYERGSAFILRSNNFTEDSSRFFARSNQRRQQLIGGQIRLEGEPKSIVAEIMEDEGESIQAFNFDNGDLRILWKWAWPKSFHDISTKEISLSETTKGSLARTVVDQCMAATARDGLLANVDATLDEFGEHIPTLRR